jgi:phospholipid/cholesterol/gamma-HCH transport system substrate-binding protein
METRGLEIKVGLVALGAMALLAGFVLVLGDFAFGKTHTVYVTFSFSGGLEPGAQVKIAGFRAGKVKDVSFVDGEVDPKTQQPVYIKVAAQIDEKIWPSMREGAAFHINTQGLIGEQYLEIVPGPVGATSLTDGQVVRGIDPIRTDLLLGKMYTLLDATSGLLSSEQGGEVAESLRVFLQSAGTFLTMLSKSFEGREKEIGEIVTRINELITEAKDLAHAAAVGLEDGEKVKSILTDGAALVKKGSVAADKIDKILTTTDTYLEPTLKDAQEALAEVRKATKVISEVGADPEKIKAAISDLTKAAERLDKITADAQAVMTMVKSGDGTIALLLRDSDIYDDLKEMLRDLKKNPWKFLWKE